MPSNYVSATGTWENPLNNKKLAAPPQQPKVVSGTINKPPQQGYQTYDYSGIVNKANQAPAQYQSFDYGKSANLANRAMSTNSMGQATNANAVNNQINRAANTLSNPTMQNGNLVGQLTGDILQNLNPVRQQQNAAINQQYNNAAQRLAEHLAASGANRGGNANRQMMGLEQGRNTALANANASLVQNALAQALPFGQLQLSERGLLQGQQQTAANQLASLLGQQEASRQWATGFNADQMQQQFQNVFNTQQAQAGENRFGQQFNADQMQQQFANMLAANQLAAGENRFGQQFNQQESQFARQLAEQIAARQAQNALQAGQLTGLYNGQDTLEKLNQDWKQGAYFDWQQKSFSDELANRLAAANIGASATLGAAQAAASANMSNAALSAAVQRERLAEDIAARQAQDALQAGQLTGLYNGQETLGAQQLANQMAQQAKANKFTEAGLTGKYNGQNTLAGQQQEWAQNNARDLLATQLWGAYLENAPNAGAPQSAVAWINQMFKR